MPKHYSGEFLRKLRNDIDIDALIVDLLKLEVQNETEMFRFRCPLCHGFHTATNKNTNLARCFECRKNFNPIDMVMTVGKCGFLDAVDILKDRFNL